jgi:hypothetical protein
MLVEDTSSNKRSFQVRISLVLRFMSICDLLTDSASCDLSTASLLIEVLRRFLFLWRIREALHLNDTPEMFLYFLVTSRGCPTETINSFLLHLSFRSLVTKLQAVEDVWGGTRVKLQIISSELDSCEQSPQVSGPRYNTLKAEVCVGPEPIWSSISHVTSDDSPVLR